MAINRNWNIRSRSKKCHHTEKRFEDGDTFYTAIFSVVDGFERKDYSESGWAHLGGEHKLSPFSFWQSTFEIPPPEEEVEVVPKESAEDLLRRLIDEDEPHTENARYILALMLERKRVLKPVDTQEHDQIKTLIYERAKTGEVFLVKDPELHLSELEPVQQEVADLLSGNTSGADSGETET